MKHAKLFGWNSSSVFFPCLDDGQGWLDEAFHACHLKACVGMRGAKGSHLFVSQVAPDRPGLRDELQNKKKNLWNSICNCL